MLKTPKLYFVNIIFLPIFPHLDLYINKPIIIMAAV